MVTVARGSCMREFSDCESGSRASAKVDCAMESDTSDHSHLKEHEAKAAETVPTLPAPVVHHYVKVLVAGESGLGKTTCINNLFRQYAGKNVVDKKCGSRCTLCNAQSAGMQISPSFECSCGQLEASTEAIIEHEEFCIDYSGKDVAHFTLVDTPGYGNDPDFESSILRIEEYIKKQNRDFESKEMLRGRQRRMARGDVRVTFVLYFIAPHRLKGIDITFFNRIQDLVPVIPIIAKADTMTLEEMKEFKREVAAKLKLIHSDMYNRDENVLCNWSTDMVAQIHKLAPFAVISSKKSDAKKGFHYPIREYPWGTCEAMNPEHSDLAQLKEELFSGSFRDLQDEKEERYCRWQEREAEVEQPHPRNPNTSLNVTNKPNSVTPKPKQANGYLAETPRWKEQEVKVAQPHPRTENADVYAEWLSETLF